MTKKQLFSQPFNIHPNYTLKKNVFTLMVLCIFWVYPFFTLNHLAIKNFGKEKREDNIHLLLSPYK